MFITASENLNPQFGLVESIGNRTRSTLGTADSLFYCANGVNQYEATAGAPGCATPFESFGYDDDGNLAYDGTFLYEWDGESRLKAVYVANPTSTDDKKVVFTYDYMSRRVRRQSFFWSTDHWQLATDQLFVYDDWNVIMVLDGLDNNAVTRKYSWGLDHSGTFHDAALATTELHGAGGIGGLLAVEETAGPHQGSYWFFYDANGNVGQLISVSGNLPIAARYEYDAYGDPAAAPTGTYADANPFRFSTKWLDVETGLYYYGYRYYDPGLGRWINRDPTEEGGGWNLYAYVSNEPAAHYDPRGLERCYAGYCACDGGDVRVTVYRSWWAFWGCITLPDWTIHCSTRYTCVNLPWQLSGQKVDIDARVYNPVLNHECGHICDLKRSFMHYLIGALPWVDYGPPAPTGGLGKARRFTK